MQITEDLLKKILVEPGVFTEKQFTLAQEDAKAKGITLYEYLLDSSLIKNSQLAQLIAAELKIPYIDLKHTQIDKQVLKYIPEKFAREQLVFPFKKEDKTLYVATANPTNFMVIDFMRKKLGLNIKYYFTADKDIKDMFDLYVEDVENSFEKIIEENVKIARNSYGKSKEHPIIKIVDEVIDYAYKNKASDIHIEPEEKYSLLRFRIDGMLHDIAEFPIDVHEQIVTRIKVMSNLRTDVRQQPQDGKIQKKMYDETLNLRVSLVPVTEGEKVVLRLLSEKSRKMSLKDLGFREESLEKIELGYKKPYGMILTTGPTGSGKTTTLYAILKNLNRREINIMTIEDPVEYEIAGISQIQVNNKAGLTFASGLRAIVRQDPDVILVGEIRDSETASIAVNSSMTGHLVLSTLHANDAATTVPRLFDMGVEPFLVASSLNVIVGQRLVRRICDNCKVSVELSQTDFKTYAKNFPAEFVKDHFKYSEYKRVYKGKGCDECHGTGYSGRVGIYEVMEIDDDIRVAIVNKQSAATIAEIAISKGMKTMLEDGLDKVKLGVTTIDEVIRVSKE